ncbi:MAG: crotonase [Firmicutes bacterium]|nr:crotonase [Bacillota bacterium]
MSGRPYTVIIYEKENGLGLVTINRPEALNALNEQVFLELGRVFDEMAADDEVKAIVLTGSGNKAFAAGSDIGQMRSMTTLEARRFARQVKEAQGKIASIPKPVVAAISGFALGGGCEVAMCCDFRIAAENAKFGQPEINLAIIPGGGGTQRLARLVGVAKAKELVLTGKIIDANEALSIGLVNLVVPIDALMDEAKKLASNLAQKGGVALMMAKMAIDRGVNLDLESALDYEIECFAECFSTADQKEGMAAFVEKRKPNFIGK